MTRRANETDAEARRSASRRVGGVDGCRAGWVVVHRAVGGAGADVEVAVAPRAATIIADEALVRIGIDVPIGLAEAAARGGRACDVAARRLLGRHKASSVFSPPVRAALDATDYAAALAANRASSATRIGLSKQCWHLFAKIREVDACLAPSRQERVFEVHPELSFWAMNGGAALRGHKKRVDGQRERIALLQRLWAPEADVERLVADARRRDVAVDDIVDAMAVCWTAERVLRGAGERVPPEPPTDARGLRMEIWR